MTDAPSRRLWRVLEPLLVVLLLVSFWLLATSAVRDKSATFDEVAHLIRGHVAWATGDFRLSPPHPPLPPLWATAPLWSPPAQLPSLDEPSLRASVTFTYGRLFLYGSGNDHRLLLHRARSAIAVFGMVLGLVIFLWSRALFGRAGGLTSLALFCFTPAFLAHGALMTTDLTLSLTLCATMAAASWAYRRLTPLSVAAALLTFVAALLTKLVALIVLPLLLAWIALLVFAGEPLRLRVARREVEFPGRRAKLGVLSAVLALQLLSAWAAMWAVHGFQYETFRLPPSEHDRMRSQSAEEASRDSWEGGYRDLPALEAIIEPLRRSRLLPETLLYSFVHGAQDSRRSVGWLDGEVVRGGTRSFFPKVVAYKTPPPLLAALVLALASGVVALRRGRDGDDAGSPLRSLLPFAPAWLLLLGYGAMMLGSHVNLGERHLLPVWPPALVLCGAAAGWLSSRRLLLRAAVPLVIAGLAITTLIQWPHFLASFSPFAGGSAEGRHHLIDSSLDWGQDLPALAQLLEDVPGQTPVYLSYFGSAVPAAHGIEAVKLPLSDEGYRPGLYCVSFTNLQQAYLLGQTAWTDEFERELRELEARARSAPISPATARRLERLRFGRLCAWLRTREPDARAGWSIGVWGLNAADLEAALVGPLPGS